MIKNITKLLILLSITSCTTSLNLEKHEARHNKKEKTITRTNRLKDADGVSYSLKQELLYFPDIDTSLWIYKNPIAGFLHQKDTVYPKYTGQIRVDSTASISKKLYYASFDSIKVSTCDKSTFQMVKTGMVYPELLFDKQDLTSERFRDQGNTKTKSGICIPIDSLYEFKEFRSDKRRRFRFTIVQKVDIGFQQAKSALEKTYIYFEIYNKDGKKNMDISNFLNNSKITYLQ